MTANSRQRTEELQAAAMRLVTREEQERIDALLDPTYQAEVMDAALRGDTARFTELEYDPRNEPRRQALRDLERRLMDETGCSKPTARQHVARALRRRRGEAVAERQRGGTRPGAGAPPGNDNRWKSRRPAE
jgi:hypothetical protein